MFDIGWTEMLVIAVVMIVVVGPKDLPKMLRTFGRTTAKLRTMAGDFQKQFNEALKEAELDDVKKSVDELRSLNPANEIKKSLNPFEKAAADVRAGLESLKTPAKPADVPTAEAVQSEPVSAEPLKYGAPAVPVAGPTSMPEPPVVASATASTPVPAASSPAPAVATAAENGKGEASKAAAGKPVSPKPVRKAAAAKSAPKTTAAPAKATGKSVAPAGSKAAAKPRKTVGSDT